MKSILPNTFPGMTAPVATAHGTFQIVLIPELDCHGLFFTFNDGVRYFLASCDNAHSLRELRERIMTRSLAMAKAQLLYIRECGGAISMEAYVEDISKLFGSN